jgi:dipeptidyl aminopeptidase/acylaminoacyl peptidase
MPPLPSRRPALLLLTLAAAWPLGAQTTTAAQSGAWDPQAILRTEAYVQPPARVAEIMTTPRVDISFTDQSPDGRWFLRATGTDRSDIAINSRPREYLGGLVLDAVANRARSLTTSTRFGLSLIDPRTGAERVLETPRGASISGQVWSPTGQHIAYIASFERASYAYVVDVASGKSTRLSERPLLATLVTTLAFTGDGRQLVTVLLPTRRAPEPLRDARGALDGPQVRLTDKKAVPQAVHYDLLEDPHDKARLVWHATGQVALIDVRTRRVTEVGAPTMVRSVDASHDGAYLRVTRMTEPFSYIVPVSAFGSVQELWDRSGSVVHTLSSTPLREGGRGGAPAAAAGGGRGGAGAAAQDTAKRGLQWNPVGAGLLYLQNDGAGAKAVRWAPPFGAGDTTVILRGGRQLGSLRYSTDSSTLFFSDSGTTRAVRVADPSQRFDLGRSVSLGGVAGGGGAGTPDSTAGTLVSRSIGGTPYVVLSRDRSAVLVTGTRAPGAEWHRQAPRPWTDRVVLAGSARSRVLDSPADLHEELIAPVDEALTQFVVLRESRSVIPDVWLVGADAPARKLTANRDAAPEISGAIVKRFPVTRQRDGTPIWVDVTLPASWRPGTKLPGLVWFYPREYATAEAYQRSRYGTNINRYPLLPSARPSVSTKLFVAHGYVHIEPDIPIFGDSGRMNDNYTRDLVENLRAVLDAVVDSGFVDRDKMSIGGHSYGAFSTVNAMALMPDFKAGIAGDGMYNRTLTPFGFQSERRSFYEAQATYLDMSPFLRADNVAGALLLYHSFEDQNAGTSVISSQRMYAALQGLGKDAAMYLYHHEDHWFYTIQSDLDLWGRMLAWLDVHLRGAGSLPKAQ